MHAVVARGDAKMSSVLSVCRSGYEVVPSPFATRRELLHGLTAILRHTGPRLHSTLPTVGFTMSHSAAPWDTSHWLSVRACTPNSDRKRLSVQRVNLVSITHGVCPERNRSETFSETASALKATGETRAARCRPSRRDRTEARESRCLRAPQKSAAAIESEAVVRVSSESAARCARRERSRHGCGAGSMKRKPWCIGVGAYGASAAVYPEAHWVEPLL